MRALFRSRRHAPAPAPVETFVPCWSTACPYAGWVRVTVRHTGDVVDVCAGCHATGAVHGWWVA